MLSKEQKIQENEYILPTHWLLKRALRERYFQVSRILSQEIKEHFTAGSILDIGCGDGRSIYDLRKLLGNKFTYTGTDYSKKAILFAEAFHYPLDTEFFCIKAEEVQKITERRFDIIIFRDVLEHLGENELRQSLQGAYDVIKNTGMLLVTVPSTNSPTETKHYRHYTKTLLSDQLESKYFQLEEIRGYVYQPPYIRNFLFRIQNMPIVWRLYRPFLRIVEPEKAKILIGIFMPIQGSSKQRS